MNTTDNTYIKTTLHEDETGSITAVSCGNANQTPAKSFLIADEYLNDHLHYNEYHNAAQTIRICVKYLDILESDPIIDTSECHQINDDYCTMRLS